MKVTFVLVRNGAEERVVFDYRPRAEDERPMALDVLLQARATAIPDLAFRYGCRNRTCGVCTVDIDGRPRIACRARVREGAVVSAPGTLPVLRDLVSRRDGVGRQLRGRVSGAVRGNDLNVAAPDDYHALAACIECYACLHNCPMHERNFEGAAERRDESGAYRWGNPFSLLKLRMRQLDPAAAPGDKAQAQDAAADLGLDVCRSCPGCKCGVGIDLKRKVIRPLLDADSARPGPGEDSPYRGAQSGTA